jgi:predicted ATPase
MINKWIMEHFKSVNEKTSLELAPLTVFAGANNSGKSTVIQSILLTTQTIQSQVHARPVILNGHIVRLGTFNDILSNFSDPPIISLGFEIIPTLEKDSSYSSQMRYFPRYFSDYIEHLKSISCIFSFSATGKDVEKDILQLQPKLEGCTLKVEVTQEEKTSEEAVEIRRTTEEIDARLRKHKVAVSSKEKIDTSGLEYEVISKPALGRRLRRYIGVPTTGEVVGSGLQHFLPSRFVVVYDKVEEQSRRVLEVLLNPEHAVYYERRIEVMPALSEDFANNILATLDETIKETPSTDLPQKRIENAVNLLTKSLKSEFTPVNIRKASQSIPVQIRREFFRKIDERAADLRKMLKAGRQSEYNLAYVPLSGFLEGAVDFVQAFFANQVKYLGPLRDEPKPVYPLAGSVDPKDIGFKGENTAAVLEVHRNAQIHYVPCSAFSSADSSKEVQQTSLLNAVLDWLDYMGVAHDLCTVDKGKLGHELKVSTSGSSSLHDLIHVGVGVSQVLPILVQSLLSEPGSTLIFEQPELHLHPKVQTRLADFFVSMTMLGKQCLVETHSEYLINRLRYQSAIIEGDTISKNVILYFVEKETNASNYRLIRINKYGVIEDWPKGFFEENEETAAETLRAGIEKHKKEKKDGGGK